MRRKMIYHGIAIIGIVIVVFLSVASGASAPAVKSEKYFYPTDTELYPAIYGAIAAIFPNASFTQIDFYNNRYTISGITGETENPNHELRLTNLGTTWYIRYDLSMTLLPSGEIVPSYGNIYAFQLNSTGQRVATQEMNNFGKYDYTKDVKRITTLMTELANDPTTFEKCKVLAMNDIRFVYVIVKNFSAAAFNDFIDNYAKGSVFSVKGTVYEVGEANRQINGKLYKYVITVVRSVASDQVSGGLFPQQLIDYIYCRYYTNDNTVIRLNKSDSCTINGILVGAEQGKSDIKLYLDMIEKN